MPSAAENHEINRIGNMPTFSISEYNESLLSSCRTENMYQKNRYGEEKYLTQYLGTYKRA